MLIVKSMLFCSFVGLTIKSGGYSSRYSQVEGFKRDITAGEQILFTYKNIINGTCIYGRVR